MTVDRFFVMVDLIDQGVANTYLIFAHDALRAQEQAVRSIPAEMGELRTFVMRFHTYADPEAREYSRWVDNLWDRKRKQPDLWRVWRAQR